MAPLQRLVLLLDDVDDQPGVDRSDRCISVFAGQRPFPRALRSALSCRQRCVAAHLHLTIRDDERSGSGSGIGGLWLAESPMPISMEQGCRGTAVPVGYLPVEGAVRALRLDHLVAVCDCGRLEEEQAVARLA